MTAMFKFILRRVNLPLSLLILRLTSLLIAKDEYKQLRAWWYNKIYDGRQVELDDISYVLHCHDVVSGAIFTEGVFDDKVFETLKSVAPFCNAYIDIGANIGAMSVRIGKKTSLPIYAVEPVSTNFELLQKNLEINGLSSRSTLANVALGNTQETTPIYLSTNNFGDHRLTILDSEERENIEFVDMITFDTFLKKYVTEEPPFVIKMDVQGFEPFVLKGFQNLKQTPCIIVTEIWAYGLVAAKSSVQEFETICHTLGLTPYYLPDDDHKPWGVIDDMGLLFDSDDSYQHTDILLTNIHSSELADLLNS